MEETGKLPKETRNNQMVLLKNEKKDSSHYMHIIKNKEFPGGPVVRTQHFHGRGPGFNQSLLGELRSRKPQGTAKTKRKKNRPQRQGYN